MSFFTSLVDSVAGSAGNLIGGLINRRANESAGNKNRDLQMQFAKNGIRWKVEDAKAAGLHPLFALSGNTVAASPSYVGDTSMGAAVANMGQDISRSIHATRTAPERALALEHANLQNEFLRAQIAKLNNSQVGPPMPGEVQTYGVDPGHVPATELWKTIPAESTSARLDNRSIESGPSSPAMKYYDTPFGRLQLPSDKATQAMEDMGVLKYAVTIGANIPEVISAVKNIPAYLIYLWLDRPAWVKNIEAQERTILLPYHKDGGKLYWRPLGKRN